MPNSAAQRNYNRNTLQPAIAILGSAQIDQATRNVAVGLAQPTLAAQTALTLVQNAEQTAQGVVAPFRNTVTTLAPFVGPNGSFQQTIDGNATHGTRITAAVTGFNGGIAANADLNNIVAQIGTTLPPGTIAGYQPGDRQASDTISLLYAANQTDPALLQSYAISLQTELAGFTPLDDVDQNSLITTVNNGTWERTAITTLNANDGAEVIVRNVAIGTAIATEVTARNVAIGTAIATEVTARNAAIGTAIANGVSQQGEIARATAAEGALGVRITGETIRATAAEGVLRTDLINELTRAKGAENALGGRIDAEVNARNVAIGTAIANGVPQQGEIARATAAEAALGARIISETDRARLAEGVLNISFTTEKLTRANADKDLSASIRGGLDSKGVAQQGEIARATAAEAALGARIISETARATGVEGGLSQAIMAEKTDRVAAINAERAARIAAINAEADRAIAAERAITLKLDSHTLQLVDHEARLISAEANIQRFIKAYSQLLDITPQITFSLVGGALTINWTNGGELQSTTSLTPPIVWTGSGDTDGSYVETNPGGDSARYYRILKP